MIKSILKETCIMLLLCVAIILVLFVIFYDHFPSNKVVPNKLATYTTPENVQTEIEEQIVEMDKQNVTYTITGADLNVYKQNNGYTTGKPDPFSASPVVNENPGGSTNTNSSTNNTNQNNTSTNTTTDPNSTGTFFNNTGLK